jgi:XTP/dITP diphosphohydrolase
MIALLVATRNLDKIREIREILGCEFKVRDLSAHPQVSQITETGKTFHENARLKAVAVAKQCAGLVIADDSGLEVDALCGAPGIFSARHAGAGATGAENIAKLLRELAARGISSPEATGRFRCLIALARGGTLLANFDGVVEGKIVHPPRGDRGFGYDPVFVPVGFQKTFAELPREVKNRISHRAQALEKLKEFLQSTGKF